MRDRFTRGFIAGLAAGIVMNIFSFLSFALNWVEVRFLDWAGMFIFGRQPEGVVEVTLSLTGQLFFTALLGVIFAYLVSITSSKNYIFKGLTFGLAVWFSTYAIAILFRVPTLTRFGVDTVTSNIVGALLYGLVLALMQKWLEERIKV